jgi:hypothetical protein
MRIRSSVFEQLCEDSKRERKVNLDADREHYQSVATHTEDLWFLPLIETRGRVEFNVYNTFHFLVCGPLLKYKHKKKTYKTDDIEVRAVLVENDDLLI